MKLDDFLCGLRLDRDLFFHLTFLIVQRRQVLRLSLLFRLLRRCLGRLYLVRGALCHGRRDPHLLQLFHFVDELVSFFLRLLDLLFDLVPFCEAGGKISIGDGLLQWNAMRSHALYRRRRALFGSRERCVQPLDFVQTILRLLELEVERLLINRLFFGAFFPDALHAGLLDRDLVQKVAPFHVGFFGRGVSGLLFFRPAGELLDDLVDCFGNLFQHLEQPDDSDNREC